MVTAISPYTPHFDIIRFIIGVALLGYASWSDWKTRRVTNLVWYIMCLAAGVILCVQFAVANAHPAFYLSPVVFILIFALVVNDGLLFYEHRSRVLKLATSSAAYCAIVIMVVYQWRELYRTDARFTYMIAMYIMILVSRLMYDFRLLHGGADAKAIMALSMLVPFVPTLSGALPLLRFTQEPARTIYLYVEPMFPPALIVLFNAVVFFIFAPVVFFVYNAVRRDLAFPQSFFGYKMPREAVPKKFVWLMETIVDGQPKTVILRRDDSPIEDQLEPFRELGQERVWVTPKLPFMIPILIGFVLTFIVGNIMFGLILALGG